MNLLKSDRVYGGFTGVALSAPFVADFFPWAITALLLLPSLFIGAFSWRSFRVRAVPIFVWIAAGILAAHVVALITTNTPFASSVIKESAIAAVLLVAAALCPNNKRVGDGFFFVVCAVGLSTAALGLVKLGLQDRGYLLWFIAEACPLQYPQGSNLCADYNLLGMLWLVAATGIVSWRLRTKSVLPLFLLPILLAAGLGVGSRRFLVLAPFIPAFWLACTMAIDGRRRFLRELVIVLAVIASSFALNEVISDPERYERFRVGTEVTIMIGGPNLAEAEALLSQMQSANRAGATVIAGTILDDGFASRLGRWQKGLDLFLMKPLSGWGFDYHNAFAANTPDGLAKDYPHLPVLSEGIIGGVVLILATGALYAILVLRALSAPARYHAAGIPFALLIVTAVTAISGDTIFSLSHWLAIALVFILSVPKHVFSAAKVGLVARQTI